MPLPITLLKTGVGKMRQVHGDTAGGKPLEKLKTGASLRSLQDEYVLFTYAPLFLFGGLDMNPVQEWINLYDHQQVVFILPLEQPIFQFRRTESSRFESVLWAVQKEFWSSLAMHIGSIGIVDRTKKVFSRVICQEIPVLDVNALSNDTVCVEVPSALVYTFSVDSSKGCLAFVPATKLGVDKPRLTYRPPREETLRLAKALFKEENDPYGEKNGS